MKRTNKDEIVNIAIDMTLYYVKLCLKLLNIPCEGISNNDTVQYTLSILKFNLLGVEEYNDENENSEIILMKYSRFGTLCIIYDTIFSTCFFKLC